MDQGLQVSGNRPRAGSRSFSLRSDKSQDKATLSLTQSQINEKHRRDSLLRGESKANPNAAMIEAQPAGSSLLQPSSLHYTFVLFHMARFSLKRSRSSPGPGNADANKIKRPALAASELTTLSSLRASTYKDVHGNQIGQSLSHGHYCATRFADQVAAEPDLCNPTRPRWERPLDTIRSFEKAIDGGYQRRSTSRSGTSPLSCLYKIKHMAY